MILIVQTLNNLEIFITIHALSTWNELGRSQGHCDTELSERGCFMAQQLALRKDLEHVKKIYTSDLKRAYQTAQPLSERLKIPIIKKSNLREGNWEHYFKQSSLKPLPFARGFETKEDLRRRAQEQMNEIVSETDESPILIVTHGGFLREFIKSIDQEGRHIYEFIRTAINRLLYVEEKFAIQSLNDYQHLEGVNLGLSKPEGRGD